MKFKLKFIMLKLNDILISNNLHSKINIGSKNYQDVILNFFVSFIRLTTPVDNVDGLAEEEEEALLPDDSLENTEVIQATIENVDDNLILQLKNILL